MNERTAVKYYLLERGATTAENTLHVFDSEAQREAATIECIWGEPLECPLDRSAWQKMRKQLKRDGVLTLEGDPGLEWFTATPAAYA